MKLDAILIILAIMCVVSYLAPGGMLVGVLWTLNIAMAAHRTPLVGKNGLFVKK